MIVVHRQHDLLDVVGALGPASGLAGTLGGRQQEPHEHSAGRRRGQAGYGFALEDLDPLGINGQGRRGGEEQGPQLIGLGKFLRIDRAG